MRDGVPRGLDFAGITRRADFWWFALAVAMWLALAGLPAEATGPLSLQIASLLVLLPWLAACTRRLRDAGLSPRWRLVSLAPVGGIVVLLCLLGSPSRTDDPGVAAAG